MTTTVRPSVDERGSQSVMTPRWALKRALIGVALLLAFAAGMALLLDAAIEPDAPAPVTAKTLPG